MKQSRIDFIKEAHRVACSEWQARIEKEFPKIFKEEFKVGDWVIPKANKYKEPPKRIISYDGGRCPWFVGGSQHYSNGFIRKATKEEIESHLIAEAKRRGFVNGANFKSVSFPGDGVFTIIENTFRYDAKIDSLSSNGRHVYCDGKWAEIIEQTPVDIRDIICKYGKEELKKYL